MPATDDLEGEEYLLSALREIKQKKPRLSLRRYRYVTVTVILHLASIMLTTEDGMVSPLGMLTEVKGDWFSISNSLGESDTPTSYRADEKVWYVDGDESATAMTLEEAIDYIEWKAA